MNSSTRLRLAKEARALLPMWAAVAVWIAAPFLLPVNDPLPYAFTGFLFGCAVLGPVGVGHEFTHRTMGVLLAQPVPRHQLWREKLVVTGVALLGLSALLVALIRFNSSWPWGEVIFELTIENDPWRAAMFIAISLLVPLMAFCTGPALTLVTRNALGGAAATFIYPFFLLIAGLLIVASMGDLPGRLEEQFLLSYVLLIGGLYSGGMFLYGCRRFERLEDVNTFAQEFAPPRQVSMLFSGLTRHLAPARQGPTANLLRKELRLQQPAFLVAAFLVALWLTFSMVWKVHPPVGAEMLIVPSILLALGIPITVGIVSTAEERNLGVHEWHLTLPASAWRQWCVKVIVALVVNAVLGLLLPGLLAHASSWLANNPQLVAEIPGRNVSPLIIANLVIFCAALYASTAAANSMRALIGTIVLFLAGAMVMNLAIMIVDRMPDSFYLMPDRHGWWPAPELCRWAYEAIAPLGWGFLVWFGALGLANFRRSVEAGWRPVRRLVPFAATIWLVLVSIFTFHRMFSHYDWTYYEMSSSLRWDSQNRAKQRAVERGRLEVVPPTPAQPSNTNPAKPRD